MENEKQTTLAKDKLEFVSGIITNKEGNVLILKRRKDLKLDPGKFDLCSGHMKEGELPLQSMYREIEEETGIDPYQIKSIEKIGDIETPHEKLKNTVTHIFHAQIEKSLREINKSIKNMQKPEMEKALFLKDVETLRVLQRDSEMLRTVYTDELENIFKIMEERMKVNQKGQMNQKETSPLAHER